MFSLSDLKAITSSTYDKTLGNLVYQSMVSWFAKLEKNPGTGNWLLGHAIPVIFNPSPNSASIDFHKTLGHTIKYRTQFGSYEVSTIDPTAISYILNHHHIFVKPPSQRQYLESRMGHGLITAMGDDHKHQRRLLGPSFSAATIKEMAPVFYDVAYQLCDKFRHLVADKDNTGLSSSPPKPIDAVSGGAKIEVLKYINMATFDVMGRAGFGHAFEALSEKPNRLTDCMHRYIAAIFEVRLSDWLAGRYHIQIPSEHNRTINREKQEILDFAKRIAGERKNVILKQSLGEGINKKQDIGKDLLSILIKANMASDLEPHERLSDEVLADQILTFARSETVATSLSIFLSLLSEHPDVHDRLRTELVSVDDDRPTVEVLDNLPYLDAFVREALRFFPAAPWIFRSATGDATVPLGTPIKGKDGKLMTSFNIDERSFIFFPLRAINTSTTFWGPDAETFDPSRFLDGRTENLAKLPGVYGNMMTFLAGPRNCIGYRFAVLQMKVMLFALLRGLEFRELKSKPETVYRPSVVVRAHVKGEEHLGAQVPLMVIPLDDSGHVSKDRC
ncbi:hypothetical protein B9479_005531 [Cryptococcus floricola]|uniref:Cytochrome P450 n=1 Tax=Cryptococcus floricola TaxID=2591691 RepID=A0A5D3AT24_9TREE|nr:hypothetical protein B9479_005531 [Cryptococcus floricola]